MLRLSGIVTSGTEIKVLDNATGGGILMTEVFNLAKQHPDTMKLSKMIAADNDERMLDFVRNKQAKPAAGQDERWKDVEVMTIDQQSIPLPDETFTHLFSNMGIFFCLDDAKALREAYRVLVSGGTAGFTSWKSIAWWSEVAQPAVAQFIPDAPPLPSLDNLFPQRGWSDPEAIPAKLEAAGFKGVEVKEYAFTPEVEAEEFAEATGVLVKIAIKRLWPESESGKFAEQIEPALLRYLKEKYDGGRWSGKMTALISLGKKA